MCQVYILRNIKTDSLGITFDRWLTFVGEVDHAPSRPIVGQTAGVAPHILVGALFSLWHPSPYGLPHALG